ncbi:hypothetical protein ACVWWK_004821 [Bradyrhizobium sp. LB9.1b]
MVGLQDLDRFAVDLEAELLRRHPRRLGRARAHRGREYPVHVGEDADADDIALDFRVRGGACERQRDQQDSSRCRTKRAHGVSRSCCRFD